MRQGGGCMLGMFPYSAQGNNAPALILKVEGLPYKTKSNSELNNPLELGLKNTDTGE